MTRSSDAYKRLKNSMSSRAQEPARISGKMNSTASPTEPSAGVGTSAGGGASANSELDKTPNSLVTLTEQDIIPAEITKQGNPKSLKRKAFKPKYGSVFSNKFDHVGFAQEYLLGGNSRVSMEGDNFQKNLEFATKYAMKIAAICQAAQNKVKGCVVVPNGEVNRLRTQVAFLEEEKHVIESEKFTISAKVTELEARLALGTRELEGLKETLKKVEEEKLAEHEKHKTVASKFIIMIEENKKLNDKNKKLYDKLKALEEERILVSKDALDIVSHVVKNLKEQVGVICPDFNVDLLSPDHEVVDGKIVDDKGNEVSEVASKEPSLGKESMLGKERN